MVVVCRLLIWGGSKNAGAIDNLVIGNSPEYLREADGEDETEIEDQKDGAAVLAGEIGKLPDVDEADGGAGGGEDEAHLGAELLASLSHGLIPLLVP